MSEKTKDNPPAAAVTRPPSIAPDGFRREWRPIAEVGSQNDVWTTSDYKIVEQSRINYPWMKFQSRLVGDWQNESLAQGGQEPDAAGRES